MFERLLSRVHHYHLFIEGDGNPGAGGGAAETGGDTGGTTETVLEKPTTSALAQGGDGGGEGGSSETPASLPDNWRELLAGGDEKALKDLSRYTTPQNVVKALLDAKAKIRSGQTIQSLPDEATPEEIAAYRKNMGVPEKPEDYGLGFPEEMKPTEADAATLSAWSAYAHERHLDPRAAKAAADFYADMAIKGRAAQEAAWEQATLESMAEMRAAFPKKELTRNMKIADEFALQHFTEHDELDAFNTVMQARLPNGVRVMDYAPFMKGLFKAARAQADEEALISSDVGGGGQSLDDERKALLAKPRLTPDEDKRLTQIYEAITAREERQGRSRAA